MSTIKCTTLQNLSGVEVYTAKAWVNFNGTGTVAIRASGNVTSITDNGTGDYTVNFTTAMPDANYIVNLSCATSSGVTNQVAAANSSSAPTTQSTTAVRINQRSTLDGTFTDCANIYATIFR